MTLSLPQDADHLMRWTWDEISPYYQNIENLSLNTTNLKDWLTDWSHLSASVAELYARLTVATTRNTADEEAKQRLERFLDEIFPKAMQAEQNLKHKLLDSGLEPEGFDIPLRNMRTEAALFRETNLPLLAEEQKLNTQYDVIIGAQTVTWEGSELTLPQISRVYQDPDRSRRERAWRLAAERQLSDREAIHSLWAKHLALRQQISGNAGLDYRTYRWRQYLRFDYTPQDCRQFHDAIEQVVVPAARRIYDRRRLRLGFEALRPWDLEVDPFNRPALSPFKEVDELKRKTAGIFRRVDPQLGDYFDRMVTEDLLDLDNRKNKAPGGYCTDFAAVRLPFIFANSIGVHEDVQTLLHEGGHAFHVFESRVLPYYAQTNVPTEFAEVASMSMELLASPYLAKPYGGFYSEADAARAQVETLERWILFWPYMAVVDAFQHWVYENPAKASDSAQCDACWGSLWQRFMQGVDWGGLEDARVTGWQRKLHIHTDPFYYVEYGLAQLGAVQVWRNSLTDQAGAVASYRSALALGGTVSLPQLFQAAGAHLAFDQAALQSAVELMEATIQKL
jgi:oligoendopeptidase F